MYRIHAGRFAAALPIWFVTLYLAMSSLRVDYTHTTKAISELGSVDAPNRWLWNVGGFILPGLVVGVLGMAIADQFRGSKGAKMSSYSLIASGLLMAMSGIFPGNFDDRTSLTMIMHAVGSFGSYLAFLICGFSLPWVLRRHSSWKIYAWPLLVLVLLSIGTGFLRTGNMPGIGQRLGVASFLAWVGLLGIAFVRNASPAATPVKATPEGPIG